MPFVIEILINHRCFYTVGSRKYRI